MAYPGIYAKWFKKTKILSPYSRFWSKHFNPWTSKVRSGSVDYSIVGFAVRKYEPPDKLSNCYLRNKKNPRRVSVTTLDRTPNKQRFSATLQHNDNCTLWWLMVLPVLRWWPSTVLATEGAWHSLFQTALKNSGPNNVVAVAWLFGYQKFVKELVTDEVTQSWTHETSFLLTYNDTHRKKMWFLPTV